MVGRMGLPIFVAPRTISISDLTRFMGGYHDGWSAGGHAGRGDVGRNMAHYVAETTRAARGEPEASTMHFYRTIGEALRKRDGACFQTTYARRVKANRPSD